MKIIIKRTLSLLLAIVLVFGVAPLEMLTDIDVGEIFGVEADAATISKDKHKVTGVCDGQSVLITTNKGNWYEKLRNKIPETKIQISVGKFYEHFQHSLSTSGYVEVSVYKKEGKDWKYVPTTDFKTDPQSGQYQCLPRDASNGLGQKLPKDYLYVGKNYPSALYVTKGFSKPLTITLHGVAKQYRIDIKTKIVSGYGEHQDIKPEDINDISLMITTYGLITGVSKILDDGKYNSTGYKDGDSNGVIYPTQISNLHFKDLNSSKITGTQVTLNSKVINENGQAITSYGFYVKRSSKSFTKDDIMWKNDKITTSKEINASATIGKLKPNSKYYYAVFAKTKNGVLCSEIKSFKTPLIPPVKTIIETIKKFLKDKGVTFDTSSYLDTQKFATYNTVEVSATDVGVGDSVKISWKPSEYAEYYTLSVNGTEDKTKIKGTDQILNFDQAGSKTISVRAHNTAGSSEWSDPVTVTVHPDVSVTFLKDGNVYQQQTLTWGHDLETLPELPTKKGNAFKGWYDSELTSAISFKNITSDIEAHAAYVTSKFTVKFAGPDGTLIGDPQIVEYGKSAVEPSSDAINDVIDTGRKFIGWNKDFSCVVENMTVTAVTDAENQDIPVEITDASAIRHEKNYVVTCNVNNLTRADVENGRVVVALKTEQGKLVTTTESAAYFLDANYVDVNGNLVTNSEFIKVVVPVIDADKTLTASVAEVYAINNYQSLVPISSEVEVPIVDRDPWGEPTTEEKTGYTLGVDMEKWIEYRSRELMLTDTTNKDEKARLESEGWVLYNTTSYKDKNSGIWTKTKPSSGEVNKDYAEKTVTDVKESTVYKYKRYKYYNTSTKEYWYSYASGWATNHGYSGKWEYKTTTEPLEKIDSVDGWYKYKGTWYSDSGNKTDPKVTTKAVTHKEYRVFNTVYTYYLNKQPETFSSWTRTPITETSTIDVEERTVYRYKDADINRIEDNSGEQRDDYIYDYLGKSFAGKQVILAIYKINEASDWTLEHIDQTVVNSDGTYEFEKYKLREDLSETTGDLTVVLGVEGTKEPIYLGKIEAPKPKYTVTFVDDITGDIISTQTVEENCDAVVPETAEHEGYTFAYWNNCSTDIRQDLEVRAMYKKNVYTVVWIDYLQEKYELEFYEHGDNLVPPFGLVETAEHIPDGWDNYISGNVVPVTSNMVIAATYKDRTFTVDFLDFDGNIVESQTVKYGETPEEPNFDYDSDEHCILFGFESKEDFDGAAVQFEESSFDTYNVGDTGEGTESEDEQSDYIIIEDYPVYNNCQIVPKFEYIETTETPTVDIKTGTYSETQVVTIDCDTDNASIFITFDGTDPVTSDTSVELAAPATVHISESQQIRFYASAFNMNPSAECSEWYAINNGNATNDYILKLAAYDDETELYTTIVDEGSLVNESLVYKPIGYTFDGAYKNVDITVDSETSSVTDVVYSDKWNFETDVITSDTTLYLKYDVNTYEVTFVDYDGFILSEQTVNYMESAVEPEKPTRENYVFVGWDTEEYLSVSGDIIVNAVYVHEDEYVTIDLNRTTYNIMSGNSFELQAITGGNVESPDIIWSSSNESVAIVDENGRVTAVGKGTAEIYAIVADNGETAVCTVTVSGNPSEELIPVVGSYLSIGTDGYIRGFNISTDEDTQLHHAETVADIKSQFMNKNIVFIDINGNTLDNSDYVGTGTVIKFMNGTEVIDSLTVVVSGDMDGDGCVTNRDASRITRYLVNKENPNEAQLYAMDVNADGYVNNRDASIVSRYLVGKETL